MNRPFAQGLLGMAVAALVASTAQADALYELRVRYEQQVRDLDATFRIQREECESKKQRELDELRIQYNRALSLCVAERDVALREIAARKEQLHLTYRADHDRLRNEYDLTRSQLRHTYLSQKAELLAASQPRPTTVIETLRIPLGIPSPRRCGTSVPGPVPTFDRYQPRLQEPVFQLKVEQTDTGFMSPWGRSSFFRHTPFARFGMVKVRL